MPGPTVGWPHHPPGGFGVGEVMVPPAAALSYFQRLKAKEKAARRQRADAERYFLGLRRRPVPGDGGGGDPSADP